MGASAKGAYVPDSARVRFKFFKTFQTMTTLEYWWNFCKKIKKNQKNLDIVQL